jgi:glycosyltransferase involved in cell wall biosynthesis
MFNRLTPGKAPLLAIEAFASLPSDTRMLIAGDGPMRQEVELDIERRGLSRRVALRPRVPSFDVPQLMQSVDVVVLPSITTDRWKEQFGRVLIEAMASGIPVVGSDSGEIPGVIGDAGIVVPENDAAALGTALRRLHDDADLRARLSKAGRRRAVECFSNKRVAKLTLEAYERAICAGAAG